MGAPTGPLSPPPPDDNPQIVKQDNSIRAVLAVVVFIGVVVFLCGAAFFRAPLLPGDTLGMVLGLTLGWVSSIIGYYYGSSSGSTSKNAGKP